MNATMVMIVCSHAATLMLRAAPRFSLSLSPTLFVRSLAKEEKNTKEKRVYAAGRAASERAAVGWLERARDQKSEEGKNCLASPEKKKKKKWRGREGRK